MFMRYGESTGRIRSVVRITFPPYSVYLPEINLIFLDITATIDLLSTDPKVLFTVIFDDPKC